MNQIWFERAQLGLSFSAFFVTLAPILTNLCLLKFCQFSGRSFFVEAASNSSAWTADHSRWQNCAVHLHTCISDVPKKLQHHLLMCCWWTSDLILVMLHTRNVRISSCKWYHHIRISSNAHVLFTHQSIASMHWASRTIMCVHTTHQSNVRWLCLTECHTVRTVDPCTVTCTHV